MCIERSSLGEGYVDPMALRMEAQLDLDAIGAVSEELDRHRYAIALEHPEIERLHRTPRKDVPAESEPD